MHTRESLLTKRLLSLHVDERERARGHGEKFFHSPISWMVVARLFFCSPTRHCSLSLSLSLSSTRKLTYVLACGAFAWRASERESADSCCTLDSHLIDSEENERKGKERNSIHVHMLVGLSIFTFSHNTERAKFEFQRAFFFSSCFVYCFYRKTGTTVPL